MKENHTYKVTGMTCNGCRTNVEKKLNEVAGVTASVNLEKGEAEIKSDSPVSATDLQDKLDELGGHYQIHDDTSS